MSKIRERMRLRDKDEDTARIVVRNVSSVAVEKCSDERRVFRQKALEIDETLDRMGLPAVLFAGLESH